MDQGLGDIGALLVIPHETSPAGHPAEGALDDPAAGQNLEAFHANQAPDDLDAEAQERCLVHEHRPVVGAVGEQVLHHGERLRIVSRII